MQLENYTIQMFNYTNEYMWTITQYKWHLYNAMESYTTQKKYKEYKWKFNTNVEL